MTTYSCHTTRRKSDEERRAARRCRRSGATGWACCVRIGLQAVETGFEAAEVVGARMPRPAPAAGRAVSRGIAADLLPQLVGDLDREGGDLGRLDAPAGGLARCATRRRRGRGGWRAGSRARPRRAASRTLWVTKTIVRPVARHTRSSSSWRRSRVIASSAANGSSMSSTGRSCASARASATRCRMPPESSCGRFSAASARLTVSSRVSAFSRRSARGTPRSRRASSTLRRAVSHGMSADSWNITAEPAAGRLDVPGGRPVEARDEVEKRRLAASRRAEQAHELAGRDVEVDVVEHERAVAEPLADVLDAHGRLDRRRRRRAPA